MNRMYGYWVPAGWIVRVLGLTRDEWISGVDEGGGRYLASCSFISSSYWRVVVSES